MVDLERVACVCGFVAEPAALFFGQHLLTNRTVGSVRRSQRFHHGSTPVCCSPV
jgi:hypothetical protein